MAIMNRGAFPLQFDREIAKMFNQEYTLQPQEFSQIAKIENFPKGLTYTEAEITGLGRLQAMSEGGIVDYDIPAEGHKKSITTVKYGRGFQVTEEQIEDELFGNAPKMAQSLARNSTYCFETNFFNLFNNGFSGGGVTAWDGVEVCGTHTAMKSGTAFSNVGAADLTSTSLQAAFDFYDTLEDEAGNPIKMTPNRLLVNTTNRVNANTLVDATGRLWSTANLDTGVGTVSATTGFAFGGRTDIPNYLNPKNGLVSDWTVFASRYITDADSWFLLSPDHDFRFYWKKKPSIVSWDDPQTGNRLFKCVTRFAVGVFNWRGVYGSPGA